jgi:hypothetical protein
MATINSDLILILLATTLAVELWLGPSARAVRLGGLLLVVLIVASLFWEIKIPLSPGLRSGLSYGATLCGLFAGIMLIVRGGRRTSTGEQAD